MTDRSVVIVGTGHAGVRAAEALRKGGWAGPVVLVGEEAGHPYQRPPVSKALLFGTEPPAPLLVAPDGIELRTGVAVAAIERDAHRLVFADGRHLPYDHLVLATGSEPRRLSFAGDAAERVFTLRRAADAHALRPLLQAGRRLLVIGGGLIGLEVAAGAAGLGLDVTVLEAAPALLSRAVPASVAAAVVDLHRQHGVAIHAGTSVASLARQGDAILAQLSDGSSLTADLVLVAAGAAPRTQLAAAAGLPVDNGIVADHGLLTTDPDISVIGDVSQFIHPLFGTRLRLESQQNAEDHGRYLARRLLGDAAPYAAVPWFWSDQFDQVLQIAGVPGLGSLAATRPLSGGLATFHPDPAGKLVGVAAFGPPDIVAREIGAARRLIARRATPDVRHLGDPTVDLRKLL